MKQSIKATSIIKLRTGKSSSNDKKSLIVKVSFYGIQREWVLKKMEHLSKEEFDRIKYSKKLGVELRELKVKIDGYQTKANDICEHLGDDFSFNRFHEAFFNTIKIKGKNTQVSEILNMYLKFKVKLAINTINGYKAMLKNLNITCSNLCVNDITFEFLEKFKRNMLKSDLSEGTTGLYLRYLRSLYNFSVKKRIIDDDNKPFLDFQIPRTVKRKLALDLEDLKKLKYYKPSNIKEKMHLDSFWFSFECCGMNFKDMMYLKNSNIVNNTLSYYRQKTKNSTESNRKVIEHEVTSTVVGIINRWGNSSKSQDYYIFPFLNGTNSEIERQKIVNQYIKVTNITLKKISNDLGFKYKITTNWARHSFATFCKRKGISNQMISEKLGHHDFATTQIYLSSFESSAHREVTELLEAI